MDSHGFEAVAVQPVKTASRWWNTVLGPGTRESEPMAHSPTECPSKRPAPHSAQSDDRGSVCWETETLINKSAVGGDRFKPVMVCRSETPCLVQVRSDRDDYRVAGSVVVKEVGRCISQPSFQELNSGFARCGVVGLTSSTPLNGHWECVVRGDAQTFEQFGTYASQQCAGRADICSGSSLANVSALGRHALPIPSVYTSSGPNPFHQRGSVVEPDPLGTFNY